MDKENRNPIPENWLINTGFKTSWQFPEGIYVNHATNKALRVGCVYYCLMDIQECKQEINDCNVQVAKEFSDELLKMYLPMVKAAENTQHYRLDKNYDLPKDSENRIFEIYRGWTKKWAKESDNMTNFAVAYNMGDVVIDHLLGGFNREQKRRLSRWLVTHGSSFGFKEHDLSWAWNTIYSGEMKRVDETNRKLARRIVQDKGFYHVRERQLITGAHYWIIIRVLGYGEQEFINKYNPDLNIWYLSFILKLFDDALGIMIPLGRPLGSKTTQSEKEDEKLIEIVNELVQKTE